MTEAAQGPYKGPFSVKHHSDAEMADHYWIEDANGKAIRGVDLRDAQWLRDTLNAATRPAPAPVGGEQPPEKRTPGGPLCPTCGFRITIREKPAYSFEDDATPPIPQPGGEREIFEAWYRDNGADVSFERDRYSGAYLNGALEITWQAERDKLIANLKARATAPAGHALSHEEHDFLLAIGFIIRTHGKPEDADRLLRITRRLTSTEQKQ